MTKAAKIVVLIIIILVIIGVAGSSYVLTKGKKKPSYNFIVVERGDLVQEVSVTGRVNPTESVELAFEKSGRVAKVYVEIGDKVRSAQLLIKLNSAELETQLQQAKANVESAEAQLEQYQAALEVEEAELAELKQGTREEEIQVSQTKVDNAQKALADAEINLENVENKAVTDLTNLYNSVEDILNDVYTKADDAVNKQTDELFVNDVSESPQLTFLTTDNQVRIDVEWQRKTVRNALEGLKADIDDLSSSDYADLDKKMENAENYLSVIRTFLNRLTDALNRASGLAQTLLNTYKGYVNTGRTNINTALSNLNNQKQAITAQKALNQQNISTAQSQINDAQNTLDSARQELNLKKAGATAEQIAAQEAQVKQAKASIVSQQAKIREATANTQNIEAQISKTALRSPMAGIVTKQTAEVGEIVAANTPLVFLMSEADFEVESNVPEVDIAKIETGNSAKITLDAYGDDEVFQATVVTIEPAETMVEGVATYKITLQFAEKDARIKSGMTANVDILTAKKENVITIPYRALIEKNREKFVRILKSGGIIEEVAVKTGLRGSDGNIEIIQGLKEGDKVITYVFD